MTRDRYGEPLEPPAASTAPTTTLEPLPPKTSREVHLARVAEAKRALRAARVPTPGYLNASAK